MSAMTQQVPLRPQRRSSTERGQPQTSVNNASSNGPPNHTRTPSASTIRGHNRTPSTDHLTVPDRADTKTQRRRMESLDYHRDRLQQAPPTTTPHASRHEGDGRTRPPRRQLSTTEVVYPSHEVAQAAFRVQRNGNSSHRKVPPPHTSRRGREARAMERSDSRSSIRSRVSFDSTRSRGSQKTFRSDLGYESDGYSSGADDYRPPLKGPSGEIIHYIDNEGLSRKEPLHRKVSSKMLKPALRKRRSRSRGSQRGSVVDERPLPPRPSTSYIGSVVNTFAGIASNATRTKSQSRPRSRTQPHSHEPNSGNRPAEGSSLGMSNIQTSRPRSHARSASHPNVNLTGMMSRLSMQDARPTSFAPSRPTYISPADDLLTYLRIAIVPTWDRWPGPHNGKNSSWGFGIIGSRPKGWEDMSPEWHRRTDEADRDRDRRRLVGWEKNRAFEKEVMEFLQENIPSHPIEHTNRWGTQIFALPADGYESLEFFDEERSISEDKGLSAWLTGTLLQTVNSTLQMVRYSSQNFAFNLITSPRPQNLPPQAPSLRTKHFLWDGFGTVVSVNKADDTDRSMVIEVRPPSVLDLNVIKEFSGSKGKNRWWAFNKELWVGDAGQANLLQAQVHDSCVQNQVHFFAVTNLRFWVFGQFNDDYTVCTVSPVIDKKARDPSLLQCLTTWVIKSFDNRHRARDPPPHPSSRLQAHAPSPTPHDEAPPYTDGRRSRRKRQTIPSSTFEDHLSAPSYPMVPFPGGINMLTPGYFELPPGPGQMTPTPGAYPQPGYGVGWGGANGYGQNVGGMPYQNNGMSWYNGGFPWPGVR